MSQTASLKQQKPSSLKSAEAGNPPARCGEDRGPQAEENLFQTLPPLSVALDNLFLHVVGPLRLSTPPALCQESGFTSE